MFELEGCERSRYCDSAQNLAPKDVTGTDSGPCILGILNSFLYNGSI